MIVITNNFKFRKWFKYGLKSKHPQQHAMKGQKLLAQYYYGHKQHALKGRIYQTRIVMDTISTP